MTSPFVGPTAVCPQCASPSIQAVQVTRKSLATTVLADELLGTAAGIVAGTTHVLTNVCLACGCQWIPGTEHERQLRALSGQLGEDAKRIELARLAPIDTAGTRLNRKAIGIAWVVVITVFVIFALMSHFKIV